MSRRLRVIGLLATASLLMACHDGSGANILDQPLEITGSWQVLVVEEVDTCDSVASFEVEPLMLIELETEFDYGEYRVFFDDVDPDGWCWVAPFGHMTDEMIRWDNGQARGPNACNPGCEIGTRSWIELTFEPGGTFFGTETTTYFPVTPECDVPACGFPCADGSGHMIFGDMRRCTFSCETTYSWSGVAVATDKTCPG